MTGKMPLVSLLERGDPLADVNHFAGAIGHRNAAVVRLDPPGDDGEVVKIQ